MNKRISRNDQADRLRITREAARILAEEGVRDFLLAKRKAAERLGFDARGRRLPTNVEIEDALAEHQRLFHGATHDARLRDLREAASRAMRLLADFRPRLVGGVLSGLAGEYAPVQLHLFADTAEQVAIHLLERRIQYELDERRLKRPGGDGSDYPLYCFMLEDVVIEAIVLPLKALRQAPASPVDGKPMKRAGLEEVEELLVVSGER